jgi:hypothetical protein
MSDGDEGYLDPKQASLDSGSRSNDERPSQSLFWLGITCLVGKEILLDALGGSKEQLIYVGSLGALISIIFLIAAWLRPTVTKDAFARKLYWTGIGLVGINCLGYLAIAVTTDINPSLVGLIKLLSTVSTTTSLLSPVLLLFAWLRKSVSSEAPRWPAESSSPALIAVVRQLRNRAQRLREAALFSLALILASLAGGFALFSAAEETSTSVPEKFENNLYDQWVDAQSRAASLDQALGSIARSDDAARKTELEKKRSILDERIKNLEERVKAADDLARGSESRSNQTRFIVSVISKRVGSVLLLIFLVQILVTLYRYSSRLAAFYDSRADALQLCRLGAFDSAEASVGLLAPDKLDFGKTPRSPIENAVELAQEILKLPKKE